MNTQNQPNTPHPPKEDRIRPLKQRIPSVAADLGDNDPTGPLTASYLVDAQQVIDTLNQALASEIMSWLTYTAHAAAAGGLRAEAAAQDFSNHATQELEHARMLIRRIDELGGVPDLDPATFSARSMHPFVGAASLERMLASQVEAERRAVEFYRESIQWIGDRDPTTRRVLEDILATEERHVNDMARFYDSL